MFDHGDIAAGLAEDAKRMLQAEGRRRGFLEDLDDDPPDILAHPLVEDSAQKSAVGFGRRRIGADSAGARRRLDHGKKLQVLGPDLLEEAVNLGGVTNVLTMDHAKHVHRDLVPL